jgi:hypothetical protein
MINSHIIIESVKEHLINAAKKVADDNGIATHLKDIDVGRTGAAAAVAAAGLGGLALIKKLRRGGNSSHTRPHGYDSLSSRSRSRSRQTQSTPSTPKAQKQLAGSSSNTQKQLAGSSSNTQKQLAGSSSNTQKQLGRSAFYAPTTLMRRKAKDPDTIERLGFPELENKRTKLLKGFHQYKP